jgi:hypothetical protein
MDLFFFVSRDVAFVQSGGIEKTPAAKMVAKLILHLFQNFYIVAHQLIRVWVALELMR